MTILYSYIPLLVFIIGMVITYLIVRYLWISVIPVVLGIIIFGVLSLFIGNVFFW